MVTLTNASDAYVAEGTPTTNYSKTRKLLLADNAASNTRFAFLYWGLPSAMIGSNVHSAKVQIRSGTGFDGSVTMTLRRVSAKFSVNRVNWSNRPGITGGTINVTKSGGNNTLWEFDVTAEMQAIADGGAWFGFRVAATNSTKKFIHSAEASETLRPVLVVEYSDAPDAPDGLSPANGKAVSVSHPTLRWNFNDDSGDTTQLSYRIRLFSSSGNANANTSPTLDTTVTSSLPQCNLATDTAYGGLADNGSLWWRVQVTDGAGLTSVWSEPATFTRRTQGTLTITNPAAPPNDFVTEPTPPISWTLSGRTQVAYEVRLSRPETPETLIWSSDRITSTDTAVTIPPGRITAVGGAYRVAVRLWDDQDRQATPGDPVYVETARVFTFALSNTVDPVDGLTGALDAMRPRIVLDWTDETMPDAYVLLRDGAAVATYDPEDLLVSGTSYQLVDLEAPLRRPTTWTVARRVNGVTSSGNTEITGILRAVTTMISDLDGGNEVFFFNPATSARRGEVSEIHNVLGSAPPVLVTQTLRGYEGSISGTLLSHTVPGLSAAQQLAALDWFRRRPGVPARMVWKDRALRVVLRNITDEPIANHDGTTEYLASAEFFQVG